MNKGYKLDIIGACLSRTGTNSLKLALDHLGYKTYHGFDCFELQQFPIWDKISKTRTGFEEVFKKEYNACADSPSCYFYKELMKENPDAKVILTIRDSPEAWWKSMDKTIYSIYDPRRRELSGKIVFFLVRKVSDGINISSKLLGNYIGLSSTEMFKKENSIKLYNKYIEDVKNHVPANKLLIFNVKEGWEPLCKFLNCKVPDIPFPRTNNHDEFREKFKHFYMLGNILLVVFVCVLLIVYYIMTRQA